MAFTKGKRLTVLALPATLIILYFVTPRLIALPLLLITWYAVFSPWNSSDLVLFFLASTFFLFQDYVSLKQGIFEFRFKDVLGMPYYEPFLWGFYFMSLKRFLQNDLHEIRHVGKRAIIGLLATSMAFSLVPNNSRHLTYAAMGSTALLFILFHERFDIYFALSALLLGTVIEIFGVSTGQWSYPQPDFGGLPFWYAAMWISVGLLGRRFMIPLANSIADKWGRYRQ